MEKQQSNLVHWKLLLTGVHLETKGSYLLGLTAVHWKYVIQHPDIFLAQPLGTWHSHN